MPRRPVLAVSVLALALVFLAPRAGRASGAPTTSQALMLVSLILVTPTQIVGLGSTGYYMATGMRPEHPIWGVYNVLAGAAGLATGALFVSEEQYGFAVPFLAAGGLELGYAAWSFFAPGEDRALAILPRPNGATIVGRF